MTTEINAQTKPKSGMNFSVQVCVFGADQITRAFRLSFFKRRHELKSLTPESTQAFFRCCCCVFNFLTPGPLLAAAAAACVGTTWQPQQGRAVSGLVRSISVRLVDLRPWLLFPRASYSMKVPTHCGMQGPG